MGRHRKHMRTVAIVTVLAGWMSQGLPASAQPAVEPPTVPAPSMDGPSRTDQPATADPAPPPRAPPMERVTLGPAPRGVAEQWTATLTGLLYRPPTGSSPAPAIVALHGCGGLLNKSGSHNARERDWARRWVAAGYVAVFPDSFGSRGLGPQCENAGRLATPRLRAADAAAAADWLAAQAFVDKSRLALVGWSHGGSTVLWSVQPGTEPTTAEFKTAIAFYPGCRFPAETANWSSRLPLTVLIGAADDWTPPEPCRELSARTKFTYIEYPGAFHAFDSPNLPTQMRTGLAYSKNGLGTAHIGTDPAARAQAIDVVTRTLADAFK